MTAAPAAPTPTQDDHEVMFAIGMALENDQRHQALALRTWAPRIKEWFERLEVAERDNKLWHANWQAANAEKLSAERRITELQADAERYRWLKQPEYRWYIQVMSDLMDSHPKFCVIGKDLDATIDAELRKLREKV